MLSCGKMLASKVVIGIPTKSTKRNESKTDKILTGPLGLLALLASQYNLKALIADFNLLSTHFYNGSTMYRLKNNH